jgi:4-hydroxybenzoyl-CoA reductase subunit beta
MTLLPEFEYKRPENLGEILSLLSQYGEEAALLAGGTDLIPRMKMGLIQPKVILSLSAINDLTYVRQEGERLKIGAFTTIDELQRHPTIGSHYPVLYEAAILTASENIRLRGTVGGNIMQDTRCMDYNQSQAWRGSSKTCFKMGGSICNAAKKGKRCFATYCGDLAPALISLGTLVCLESKEDKREIPLENLFTGNGESPFSIRRGELLKEMIVPLSKTLGGYKKLRLRRSIDYPLASIAIGSNQEGTGRLVVGAVGPCPKTYAFSSFDQLGSLIEKAYEDATPVMNRPLSPLYRKRMIGLMATDLLKTLKAGVCMMRDTPGRGI